MPLNDRDIIITSKTIKTMMNLEKLGISSEDVLQRSQLVSIMGGNGDASLEPGGGSGTCGYRDPGGYIVCNISKDLATSFVADYGGNWCCDSCGGPASYC